MPGIAQVLNDTHHKKLNAALYTLNELIPEIDKAELVGVNVDEHRARAQHLRDQIMKVKQVYFPHKP